MKSLRLAICASFLAAPLAQAHPHAFVGTQMALTVDGGAVTAIEMTWVYDAFSSLMILGDRGLDPDGDGVLTPDELAALKGFDVTNWPEDFAGDIFFESGGTPVALGDPEALDIAVDDMGRIVARHRRSVPEVPVDALTIRQFDPTYYIAYSLDGPVAVSGDCRADVAPHDPEAAMQAVETELSNTP